MNHEDQHKPFDWSLLNTDYRDIIIDVAKTWRRNLLSRLPERDYHAFLRQHAGLFFTFRMSTYITLSKLQLADDYETDFVVCTDGGSLGLRYELIEIETPSKAPYTEEGHPTEHLSRAVQQVEDWRAWVSRNEQKVRALLPARRRMITYVVVIGTRENSRRWVEKRNAHAKSLDIEIRSFDWLTDCLLENTFVRFCEVDTCRAPAPSPLAVNAMLNPFCRAMTHREWKSLLRDLESDGFIQDPYHFVAHNVDIIVKHRKYTPLFQVFNDRYLQEGRLSDLDDWARPYWMRDEESHDAQGSD